MKLYKGILYTLAATALLSACSKEDPFTDTDIAGPVGMLRTSCLAPSLPDPDGYLTTRAGVPSTDDFTVEITKAGARTPSVTYRYADMPEILTLPAGNYTVKADHGKNPVAEWEAPYFKGESEFTIEENKITEEVEPIVAKLSNIRVTIKFGPNLAGAMSADSKVTVKVGDEGVMTFTSGEARSAYFKHVSNSLSMTATFEGTVDGDRITESKTYDDVKPGNHYTVTFKMESIEPDEDGTITPGVTVDSTVQVDNLNYKVDGETDETLEDDLRPSQGGSEPDPGPGPQPEKKLPVAAPVTPEGEFAGYTQLDLDKVNDIDNLYCAWTVDSSAEGGFTSFKVDIVSDTLTPSELESVSLTDKLDLIEPGEFEEALDGLGFPVRIGGTTHADFDITGFLSMMAALGPGNTTFVLTVSDANGTSTFHIRLLVK